MKSIQEFHLLLLKVLQCRSKTGTGRAGIVDCMAFLGGTFRVDAKADGFSGFFRLGSVTFHLRRTVEYHMIGIREDLVKLILPVGRGEDMGLLPELFLSETRFVQTAGC